MGGGDAKKTPRGKQMQNVAKIIFLATFSHFLPLLNFLATYYIFWLRFQIFCYVFIFFILNLFKFINPLQKDKAIRVQQSCLFCCAIFGGLGNDVIFSFLPVVDNFFHSQAGIMVT